MTQDEDHLRLLSVFHYVVGGLVGVLSLIPLLHLTMGVFFLVAPQVFSQHGNPPPAFVGWIFIVLGCIAITLGWSLAGCILATGRFLAKRKRYGFCLVVAGVECIFMPFGTVLGVLTLIVLMREPVKALFETATARSSR